MQSQSYNGRISGKINKWAERTEVSMRSAIFKPSDTISLLFFLHNSKGAYDINGIHDGAAMWLFPHFMKDAANSGLEPEFVLQR